MKKVIVVSTCFLLISCFIEPKKEQDMIDNIENNDISIVNEKINSYDTIKDHNKFKLNNQLKYKTFKTGIRAVKIPKKNYYISETEITIGQYLQFCEAMGKHYPLWLEEGSKYNIDVISHDTYFEERGMNKNNINHPVTGVSWNDAVAFAQWVGGRLPNEAEWLHSAKGYENFKYAGSNNINEVAWYDGNSDFKIHAVKGKNPNSYGIYDMSGNVWEWTATDSEKGRVLKGGGWSDYADGCNLSNRDYYLPYIRDDFNGFRVLFPL